MVSEFYYKVKIVSARECEYIFSIIYQYKKFGFLYGCCACVCLSAKFYFVHDNLYKNQSMLIFLFGKFSLNKEFRLILFTKGSSQ